MSEENDNKPNLDVPEHLEYSDEHVWVDASTEPAMVGITEYAADQLGELPMLKPFVLDEAGQLQVRASWLSHGFHPPSFCGCVPAAPAGVCPSAVLPSACCGRSLGGLLAGKAHRQQRKAVPVHQVHGVLLVVLRVDVLGLEEQRGVPIFGEALHDFRDVADDVVMAFAEALGDVPAGCHRFAVLGG